MGKYKLYLMLLALLSFGSQGLANAFQICPETARDTIPVESQTQVIEMAGDCHQTEAETNNSSDICDAQHCCPGATTSAVYPSGHALVNMGKARINYQDQAHIFSGLHDIYHPPKLSR